MIKDYIDKYSLCPLASVRKLEPEINYYMTDFLQMGHAFFQKKEYEKAVEMYRNAVGKGQSEAWMALAICYEQGWGCQKNSETAAAYYNQFLDKKFQNNISEMGAEGFAGKKFAVQPIRPKTSSGSENLKRKTAGGQSVNHVSGYQDLVRELSQDNLRKEDYKRIFYRFMSFLEKDQAVLVMETLQQYNNALIGKAVACFEEIASLETNISCICSWYYLGLCYAKGYGKYKSAASANTWFRRYEKRLGEYIEQHRINFYKQRREWTHFFERGAYGTPFYMLNNSHMSKYSELVEALKTMRANSKDEEIVFTFFQYFLGINQSENVMDTLKRQNPELIPNAICCFEHIASTGKSCMENVNACYFLGICYAKGYGKGKSIPYAKMWFGYYAKRFEQLFQEERGALLKYKREWKSLAV